LKVVGRVVFLEVLWWNIRLIWRRRGSRPTFSTVSGDDAADRVSGEGVPEGYFIVL
jgi:hypothetical protein